MKSATFFMALVGWFVTTAGWITLLVTSGEPEHLGHTEIVLGLEFILIAMLLKPND